MRIEKVLSSSPVDEAPRALVLGDHPVRGVGHYHRADGRPARSIRHFAFDPDLHRLAE